MASSSTPILQRLYHLDKPSAIFQSELDAILSGEEYQKCASNLPGDDLMGLVDFLDKVLDRLPPLSAAFEKCQSELRVICGSKGVLPTSCALSPQDLYVSPEPFASGGYGDVYLASFNTSRVCVKRVRVPHPKYAPVAEKAFRERAIVWKRLQHPNIAPLLGFTVNPLQLVSQWMPSGSLPDYIEKNHWANLVVLLSEVGEGIRYLHSCDVIHRGIKGSNILVDPAGHAKISDFGLSMVTSRENAAMGPYQPEHSQRWTAPEALGGMFTRAADIFSFAMLMVEVFTGTAPFDDLTGFKAALTIVQGKRPPRPQHSSMSGRLWALMQRCWDHDPQLRPEADEVSRDLKLAYCQRGPSASTNNLQTV